MRNAVLTLVSLSQWLDVVILMIIIIMKMLLWCWFLYGTFCHGALKHDISTLLTTSFLWTSLQFIFDFNFKLLNTCDYKLLTKIPSGALWFQDQCADNNLCECVRYIVGSCNGYKNIFTFANFFLKKGDVHFAWPKRLWRAKMTSLFT